MINPAHELRARWTPFNDRCARSGASEATQAKPSQRSVGAQAGHAEEQSCLLLGIGQAVRQGRSHLSNQHREAGVEAAAFL